MTVYFLYKMPKPCCVPFCKEKGNSVFRVPRNESDFEEWRKAIPGMKNFIKKESQSV